MQDGRKGRLHPAVGFARNEVAEALNSVLGDNTVAASGKKAPRPDSEQEKKLVLVGCSGGPDSLALAAISAHFARRGSIAVGAVIVDHQMQENSAEVARQAAQQCADLGLSPILIKTVEVEHASEGPEMAARTARYGAFREAVDQTSAAVLLLAHTLDDQAETVLLGLARGSGTKSLSGMPWVRNIDGLTLVRPFLNVRRSQIQQICGAEGLEPWNDPTNFDQSLMRAKVRHSILPYLEDNLGGDVAVSLARTAAIIGPDADYIDEQAHQKLQDISLNLEQVGGVENLRLQQPLQDHQRVRVLNRAALSSLHPALLQRVLSLAVKAVGGQNPSFERLTALTAFAAEHSIGGPVQLAGHVSVYRRRPGIRISTPTGEFDLKQTGILVFIENK